MNNQIDSITRRSSLLLLAASLLFVGAHATELAGNSNARTASRSQLSSANPAANVSDAMRPVVGKQTESRFGETVVLAISATEESPNNVDAVVIVRNGKIRAAYADDSEAAQQKFADQYFVTGKKYRVTFGGGEVGSAVIQSHGAGCSNVHAAATVETNGRIPSHLQGLATNSEVLGKTQSSRRAPTAAERAAVMKLVDQVYGLNKTPPGWMRLLKTTNLTATDLNRDGKLELIGSFAIETKTKMRRELFLIAEPEGTIYKAVFVKFQAYKLQPEGFDSAIDFVDQLDVDGDGIGEVFATQHGFDAYAYNIYKKVKGRWRLLLGTPGDAC